MEAIGADVLVGIHFLVVLFVVGLPVLVLVGAKRQWAWVRNAPLRYTHLAVMAYVVMNALRGELCFLTHWEAHLRERAGQTIEQASFIGRLLHKLIFVEVELIYINAASVLFGLLVLISLVAVKPVRGAGPGKSSPGAD